jgi:hypothetical protein
VQVELHIGRGLPGFTIVGLPAPVVRASRERVRSALLNSGYQFPVSRITVNLAPVELSKHGGRFDLPIALCLLMASGQLCAPPRALECHGELGLAGELKPVGGLFLAALHAARCGRALIVPASNGEEVALSGHTEAYGAVSLRDAATKLSRADPAALLRPRPASDPRPNATAAALSLANIVGQWQAKRALAIAATGGHSVLMVGPPGSGKSMPTRRDQPRSPGHPVSGRAAGVRPARARIAARAARERVAHCGSRRLTPGAAGAVSADRRDESLRLRVFRRSGAALWLYAGIDRSLSAADLRIVYSIGSISGSRLRAFRSRSWCMPPPMEVRP